MESTFAALNRSQLILEMSLSGEILTANENFLMTMGYSLDEIAKQGHGLFVTEEEGKSQQYIEFWRKLSEGKFFTGTFHRVAKDGSDVWIQGVYNPVFDSGGRPYKIIKVATDVTEIEARRLASVAQNIEAREHAEQAVAAKTRFLANVSHELRTPMAAMLGMAELLSRTPLGSDQVALVGEIMESGQVLQTLVNDLLNTAQLEAGAVEIHLAPADALSIARSVQALLMPRAIEKGLKLEVSAANLPPALMIDGLRVRQILTNLVNNAIKFTTEGSVDVQLDWRKDVLHCTVVDTGEGFPSEETTRLFLPFEQRRETLNRTSGGVGLGLAICADLVSAMGGVIDAQSELGRGATFHFSLPAMACLASEGLQPKPSAPDRVQRRLRVLVAEDNSALQRIMAALLATQDCQVTLAANGQDAVNAYEQQPPDYYDICFMDLRMPIMDGIEAMQAIRALEQSVHLPIIAVSADVLDGRDRIEQIGGFDGFSPKPIIPDLIASHLDAVRSTAVLGIPDRA